MDVKEVPATEEERGKWATKTEFVLSCLGYAIGLGNVWRFPYLCYRNGGGAFLVPYLTMLFLCGIPLFYMETNIGQFSSTGCLTMFRIAPMLKGAGYAMIVVNLITTSYYSVIVTYPILFLLRALRSTLPWESCDNSWNTENCLLLSNFTNLNKSQNIAAFKTPADEFFHNEILEISKGIEHPDGIVWPLLIGDVFVWVVMYFCIVKGVESVGKVVYFTATFPFIVLAVLFLRGITLPGAIEGIRFYITPKWSELTNLKVWADAAAQIFFSLGPGWGGIVNMSSYNNFRNNTKWFWDAIIIPIINCSTSIFAGFVVFSILGFMSVKSGISVEHVATGGPALAFVTYPEAIAMLPFPNLWAVLFFSMLFFLGIDSCFVQIELVVSAVLDEYPQLRAHQKKVTVLTIVFMFLGAIMCCTRGGMYIVQLLDWYSASISVILICLVEVIAIAWSYGVSNFIRDIEFMTSIRPGLWWYISWKYITPFILSAIFLTTIVFNTDITYNNIVYPSWAINLGWSCCMASIIFIPIYIVYFLVNLKGSPIERIKAGLTPLDVKPADPIYRREYEEMLEATKNKSNGNPESLSISLNIRKYLNK